MAFRMGFTASQERPGETEQAAVPVWRGAPRRSLVQVAFGRGHTLAYYNDLFDLQKGDFVFVEGQLEGERGRVVDINYNFRIKLSDYKRVIGLADTQVKGQFFLMGSQCVTFEPTALPAQKVRSWFLPPVTREDIYASGSDDSFFLLNDLQEMNVSPAIRQRGQNYYLEDRVRYLSLDGSQGYAIVEGTHPYEVEFCCRNGAISNLTCSCYCSYNCKHEVAVMLQLQEALEILAEQYETKYARTNYFAVICKDTFYEYVMRDKETGSFTL